MATELSLLEAALGYARKGWPIFPLKSRAKIPLTVRGFKEATTVESQIKAWWMRWPNANIGLATGAASGVCVVDIDPRHGGDISFESLREKNAPVSTMTCLTGGGGKHLYFQFIPGFRNSAGHISQGIDTRGEGGYVVLPPSVHETGALYAWEDEDENKTPAELPAWLNPATPQIVPQLAAGNLSFAAGPAKANGEPVAPGSRNTALASLVGQWIRDGIGIVDLHQHARSWNSTCPEPLGDSEVSRVVSSIIKTHLIRNPGSDIRVVDPVPELVPDKIPLPPFPLHLLSPPGLVGDICKWINDTAIKPQPVLVLGNTLAFFGAVIGRKVRTPTDLRSNLYVLGVGESGCGKDHSRKSIKRICEMAGLTSELLGGEEVSSDSAILSAVHSHPSILFQFDEIGHFLANANSRYAAVHQKNIAPTFTKLFSSANTTFIGKEYAGRDREDIIQPNVCLYGTTVPGRLYEGLTPAEITDGFLGRMIVLQSDDADPSDVDFTATAPVPDAIVTLIQTWHQRQDLPRAEGNIASIREHIPISVTLENDAELSFRQFRAECRKRKAEVRGIGGLDVLWSRATEHALKVALIISSGCEFVSPIISGDVAGWSIALINHAVTTLVETVRNSVAGSDYERQLLYIQKIIADSGSEGIKRSELLRRARRVDAQQLDRILNRLLEMESISKESKKGKTGPTGTTFRRTGVD